MRKFVLCLWIVCAMALIYAGVVQAAGSIEKSPALGAPNPPSNLTVTTTDYGRAFVLHWQDNALNEAGFKVERSLDYYGQAWVEIASVGANAVDYTDAKIAVPDWNFYQYRVKAFNNEGVSTAAEAPWASCNPSGKVFGFARIPNAPTVQPNIVVTLKPTVYGYGTHDYTTNSDATGYFEFPDVIRKVSSSGGQIFWISYKLYINNLPASPEFQLKDPFVLRQDAFGS